MHRCCCIPATTCCGRPPTPRNGTRTSMPGSGSAWQARRLRSSTRRVIRPDRSACTCPRPACCSPATPCSTVARAPPAAPTAIFPPSSIPSARRCSPCRRTLVSTPATVITPLSASKHPISPNGSRGGTEIVRGSDPDTYDFDENDVVVTHEKSYAAGVPAVLVSLRRGLEQMGVVRTARTLFRLNQRDGFDCPGCAWPETPGHRKHAEFCENGAKAVAEEATTRTVGPDFFATHSVDDLLGRTEYWLGQQGRLTHPMVLRPGTTHYEPIEWDDANRIIADELNALGSPHEAIFYTSGRTSNEAAFLYQLLIRSFGTNNMPDCSNMCHESSGTALIDSIGIGKGSVTVPDLENADLILIAGQNPGTNHPRMLSTLEKAKANGAKVIAINPLPEAGLMRFKDPQKVHGVIGDGAAI